MCKKKKGKITGAIKALEKWDKASASGVPEDSLRLSYEKTVGAVTKSANGAAPVKKDQLDDIVMNFALKQLAQTDHPNAHIGDRLKHFDKKERLNYVLGKYDEAFGIDSRKGYDAVKNPSLAGLYFTLLSDKKLNMAKVRNTFGAQRERTLVQHLAVDRELLKGGMIGEAAGNVPDYFAEQFEAMGFDINGPDYYQVGLKAPNGGFDAYVEAIEAAKQYRGSLGNAVFEGELAKVGVKPTAKLKAAHKAAKAAYQASLN